MPADARTAGRAGVQRGCSIRDSAKIAVSVAFCRMAKISGPVERSIISNGTHATLDQLYEQTRLFAPLHCRPSAVWSGRLVGGRKIPNVPRLVGANRWTPRALHLPDESWAGSSASVVISAMQSKRRIFTVRTRFYCLTCGYSWDDPPEPSRSFLAFPLPNFRGVLMQPPAA